MVKLTDSQLIVLLKAAARQDGAAVVPLRMTKAAAVKIGHAGDQIQARHAGKTSYQLPRTCQNSNDRS
jgi:hypothetical protein